MAENPASRIVRRSRSLWSCLSLAMFAVFAPASVHADDAVTIEPVERWSSVFADSEMRWNYRFSSEMPIHDRGAWRLTINHRPLANGEFNLNGDANQAVVHTIGLQWPKIKAEVVQPLQLTVSVGTSRHERTVWLFPRDPFVDRREWLKHLKLKVFDPDEATIERLETAEIPFERLRSSDALSDVTDGIVIIGERCSLKKHDAAIDQLPRLVARGIPVLCLASAEGELSFPGDRPSPLAVQLRRSDVIHELDKRLDATWWPHGSSHLSGLRFTAGADQVVAEVSDKSGTWPWCEWRFESGADKRAHLIWCGFGLIRSWDDGPTPRFLFAAILERLSQSTTITLRR